MSPWEQAQAIILKYYVDIAEYVLRVLCPKTRVTRLRQDILLYYVVIWPSMRYMNTYQRHVQQGCDRPNYIKAKGPNVRPNQIHAVVDSS